MVVGRQIPDCLSLDLIKVSNIIKSGVCSLRGKYLSEVILRNKLFSN